ncbi:Uncharacterised protein [Segatella copri]|nr:Uncharacterised protein [Segatella copri]
MTLQPTPSFRFNRITSLSNFPEYCSFKSRNGLSTFSIVSSEYSHTCCRNGWRKSLASASVVPSVFILSSSQVSKLVFFPFNHFSCSFLAQISSIGRKSGWSTQRS